MRRARDHRLARRPPATDRVAWARWGLGAAVVIVLAACTTSAPAGTASGTAADASASSTRPSVGASASASTSAEGTAPGPSASVRPSEPLEIEFASLLDEPGPLVGREVAVTGRAFFLAECPPPGAGTTACVLNGYLADPDRGVLIAADVGEAIPLAEGGSLVSCEEGPATPTACEGWQDEARYRVVGVVERQVAGGRETNRIQLDVREASAID